MNGLRLRGWDMTKKMMAENAVVISGTHLDFDIPQAREGFVWLLYTGLHDSNGTEICEGDILRVADRIGPVEWERGAFWWHASLISEAREKQSVIIGNIYQNPELLS